MIRVDRAGAEVPESLARVDEHGVSAAERTLRGLRQTRATRPLREEDFGELYRNPDVKNALFRIQHRKCCYCEREVERAYSPVEHFRPKTRARRADGTVVEGYWWLAYRFENLFLSCVNCNQPNGCVGKQDHFPLDPGSRPLVPEEDPREVGVERPLLLDPSADDPAEHLVFVRLPNGRYRIAPRHGSSRGEAVARLILDRDDLHEIQDRHRTMHLEPILRRHRDAAEEGDLAGAVEAKEHAARLAAPDQPFSALARCFFSDADLL